MTSPTPPDPTDRLAELEAELARVKTERDIYKAAAYEVLHLSDVYRPLTPEEVEEMLHAPRGQSLKEIVAEFEREVSP